MRSAELYLPSHFAEERPSVLQELIRAHPLGVLVTVGAEGLAANHLPFEFDPDPAPWGTLRAHVARANMVWREARTDMESLVIFTGPSAYVSPAWYPSKTETGKVVPTYNYLVVHGYGRLQVRDDVEWLGALVRRLTARFEAGRSDPWSVSDAPADFIDGQLRAIVGLEIPVTRLLGKWKVSQNRPAPDRAGAARGLRAQGERESGEIADAVEEAHAAE